MKIQKLHPNFQLPVRSTEHSAGYDLFMPEHGHITAGAVVKVGLGFAAEIPEGWAALLLPRSGVGFKQGLEVNNTVGLIDADYRGEWFAALRTKDGREFAWAKGERLLQFVLVPVGVVREGFEVVESVANTVRGTGGLGSTGN
jgi:dUTP pyrophosphatase